MAAFTSSAALLTVPAAAASKRGLFARLGIPIGLQIYTLGNEPRADLEGVFARVAGIGYRDIEMPQLFGHTPKMVRAAADRAGLKISSLHVPVSKLMGTSELALTDEPAKLADSMAALGAKHAVVPIVPFPDGFRPRTMESFGQDILAAIAAIGPDHWKRSAALLNEKAAALKPLGVAVGYHNHNTEFAPVGKTTGWEILAGETDPALVHFEVDVGWVAAAGLDPLAFLHQYRGRVKQLHVKDLAEPSSNFAIVMKSTEIGSGVLDWAKILPAAHRAGVRNFYVEQEPPFVLSRIDAAAKSYAFLSKLKV